MKSISVILMLFAAMLTAKGNAEEQSIGTELFGVHLGTKFVMTPKDPIGGLPIERYISSYSPAKGFVVYYFEPRSMPEGFPFIEDWARNLDGVEGRNPDLVVANTSLLLRQSDVAARQGREYEVVGVRYHFEPVANPRVADQSAHSWCTSFSRSLKRSPDGGPSRNGCKFIEGKNGLWVMRTLTSGGFLVHIILSRLGPHGAYGIK